MSEAYYGLSDVGEELAQQFTTGATSGGYILDSIGIHFADFDASTVGSQLTVTLNAANDNGDPGDVLCTLSDPASFTAGVVNTFAAPGTDPCPVLEPSTAYFVVLKRVLADANAYHPVDSGHLQRGQRRHGGLVDRECQPFRKLAQAKWDSDETPWAIQDRGPQRLRARGGAGATDADAGQEHRADLGPRFILS